jgi:DNA-binding NarL/FixJ family response regulator
MCAVALDTRVAARPSPIDIVDPSGSLFQRIRHGVPFEIGGGVRAVSGARALEGAAELLIGVLDVPRDWDFVRRLCAAGPTLVVVPALTTEDSLAAIELGARGCLDLTVRTAALGAAIRGILAGEVAFSRVALGGWLRQRSGAQPWRATARLTPRQRQIVGLIAEGASDKQIGGTLGIATATAQKHVTNILERLGAPNRAAAVAIMSGLFRPAERDSDY